MILKTALLMKILCPLLVIIGGYFALRKHETRGRMLGLGALVILFALAANWVSGLIPPLRDEVTLTALGERNEAASAEEIRLTGYTIDGKEYLCGKDMEILDGKWFWSGETYCWRIETDPRQPEGVTRSVTVSVPVGWGRTLNFEGNAQCGTVEVSAGGGTQVVDTFSADGSPVAASFGKSETSMLIWNQIMYLAVYGVVFLAAVGLLYTAAVKKREGFIQFNRKHSGVLLYAAIALFQLGYMIYYSGLESFWYDELCEIGWGIENPNLFARAFVDAVPRPVGEFLLGLWSVIVPAEDRWLLLFPEICTAVGVFFIGLCGKEYKDVRTGAWATFLAAISYMILQQCAFEFRDYALFFMTASILVYITILRYKSPGKPRRSLVAAYAVTMVVCSQSHYHAYVLCAALFFLDVIAHWGLKIRKFNLIPYLVLGICTIPSAVMVLQSRFITTYDSSSWQPVPSVSSLDELMNYLSSYTGNIRRLFDISAAIIMTVLVLRRNDKPHTEEDRIERFVLFIPMYIMFFVIAFFYAYGNINTQGTLWYDRYFTDLQPCYYMVCGFGVATICELIQNISRRKDVARAAFAIIVVCSLLPGGLANAKSVERRIREPFREAADWIYTQDQNIFDDSTVIVYAGSTGGTAWEQHYLRREGARDPLNAVSQDLTTNEELVQYDRIYTFALHSSIAYGIQAMLNEQYVVETEMPDLGVYVYVRNTGDNAVTA